MTIALTPSGQPITCDGCGAPVEEVTDAMKHPVPREIAVATYGRENLVYIVCAPLPDGSQPCLDLALLRAAPGEDAMIDVRDYNGNPLAVGAHVEAWYDGIPYTATVKEIKPPEAGSGYRRVALIRHGDSAEVESFSDAVAVIEAEGV